MAILILILEVFVVFFLFKLGSKLSSSTTHPSLLASYVNLYVVCSVSLRSTLKTFLVKY